MTSARSGWSRDPSAHVLEVCTVMGVTTALARRLSPVFLSLAVLSGGLVVGVAGSSSIASAAIVYKCPSGGSVSRQHPTFCWQAKSVGATKARCLAAHFSWRTPTGQHARCFHIYRATKTGVATTTTTTASPTGTFPCANGTCFATPTFVRGGVNTTSAWATWTDTYNQPLKIGTFMLFSSASSTAKCGNNLVVGLTLWAATTGQDTLANRQVHFPDGETSNPVPPFIAGHYYWMQILMLGSNDAHAATSACFYLGRA